MTIALDELRLMNAAGWIKEDGPDFRKLLNSAVTEITIGSITHQERTGNTGTNFYVLEDGTGVNSVGLKNPGLRKTHLSLASMIELIRAKKKRVRLSIAPIQLWELENLAQLGKCHGVDTLEVDLSCKNVHDGDGQHIAAAENLDLTRQALQIVKSVWKSGELAPKLLPYEDLEFLIAMMELMNEELRPGDSVVLSNTEPGYCPCDPTGKPYLRAITPDGKIVHTGGKSGTQAKGRNLRNVRIARRHLRQNLTVTAVTGIRSGQDICEYNEGGAQVFQVGTEYFKDGDPQVFSHIGATYPVYAQ